MGAPLAFVLVVAAGVAAWLSWRAARDANFWERSFWRLLAAAAAAQGLSSALDLLPASWRLLTASRVAGGAHVVLSVVALLVRPDRSRDPGERRAASLEWLMAAVAGFFLISCFDLLSRTESHAWLEAIPALVALVLALRVRESFGRIDALLAVGYGTAALLSLWPSAREVAKVVPLLAVAAATRLSPQQDWVRPAEEEAHRSHWLASVAVVLPAMTDLATRLADGNRELVDARSVLALAATMLLVVLAALRLHPRAVVLPSEEGHEGDELVSAADSLEFASRVAHELNNPLMAVAGLAELALKKGAPETPLRGLIHATNTAAAIVTRLHQITGRSKGIGG